MLARVGMKVLSIFCGNLAFTLYLVPLGAWYREHVHYISAVLLMIKKKKRPVIKNEQTDLVISGSRPLSVSLSTVTLFTGPSFRGTLESMARELCSREVSHLPPERLNCTQLSLFLAKTLTPKEKQQLDASVIWGSVDWVYWRWTPKTARLPSPQIEVCLW